MRTSLGVAVLVALCGCQASRTQVVPQLTPIDASRPFVVFKPVKGTACGESATSRALDDLWRVAGDTHGFVAVVIEEGEKQCVTITARPIKYGCDPAEPAKVDVYPMKIEPGPSSCASAAGGDTCTPDCARYAGALSGGEFETKAFKERCISRCRANDATFLTCARGATAPADVRRCDALP
jgi:hypothetical protein